jgi:hypothetical protein
MAEVTKEQKIAAAKKSLEEAKKLVSDAQTQYAKAESLYNKAKVAAMAAQALSTETVVALGVGVAANTLLSGGENKKAKDEAKKLEKKAQQKLEKAQKVYDGAKKRMILIQDQLNVLAAQKTLQQKAESNKSISKGKVKSDSKKIKSNKTKLKAGLKKIIKTIGPLAIVTVFGKILNTYVTRLSGTVYQLGALVDKTNDTIRAATTKPDIQKAKISRDAALNELASAEVQVENFRRTLTTANRIVTILTLLLTIVAALPTAPYQLSPLAVKTTRIIAKFTPVLVSLNILIQISQTTLEGFLTTIAYERSRLLPLNDVLEQADAKDLSPEEVRSLLDTLIELNSNNNVL